MEEQQRRGRDRLPWIKFLGYAAAIILIFAFGVGVGKGNIVFGSNQGKGQNGQLPNNLDYKTVEQVYDDLRDNYDGQLDEGKLLDGMKKGLAEATGDPYTQYFTADEAKAFSDQLHGSFTGVGAELEKNADGALVIVAPLAGSPAEAAGLQAKDVIVSIDGTSTSGMAIDDAVNKIRGAAGTKVTLGVLRGATTLSFTITRAEITVPSVTWQELPGNVGYIRISRFDDSPNDPSKSTTALTQKAADEFKAKGVKSVLLDLRNDPGGARDEAIDTAGIWLAKNALVMQEKHANIVQNTFRANGSETLKGMPTAVLINGESASASEILAGALHDNQAATLFGEKSFGKGKVQQLISLPDGAELKVTSDHWFRPNGQTLDGTGITPDKPVTLTDDDAKAGRDPQKDAALTFLKGQS